MFSVCITGSDGFIGKNFYFSLKNSNIAFTKIYFVNRKTKKNDLKKIINKVDYIFHFAGENRSKNPNNFKKNNIKLTQFIVDNINEKKKVSLFYTSTTKINEKSLYGLSKKAAEDYLIKNKIKFKKLKILRFSNIFGKWAKPNHNSVVATWCHNFNHSKKSSFDKNKMMNYHYIGDVVNSFLNFFNSKKQFEINNFKKKYKISLQKLFFKLDYFSNYNNTLKLPSLKSKFDRILYATYCSYTPHFHRLLPIHTISDDRGSFSEIFKFKKISGQISILNCNKKQIRGGHYHNEKLEIFVCLSGEIKIKTLDLNTNKRNTYKLNSNNLGIFRTIPGEIHTVINETKKNACILIWANEIFDKKNPDTYFLI